MGGNTICGVSSASVDAHPCNIESVESINEEAHLSHVETQESFDGSSNKDVFVDEYLSLAANDHMTEEYITTISLYSESDDTSDESEASELSSSEDEGQEPSDGLNSLLRKWAVKHAYTRGSINELLGLLKSVGHDLPKDARTLLRTKTSVDYKNKCGGQFIHLGLVNGIEKTVRSYNYDHDTILLDFNVDGLPLFKSSATQLWPVLCRFENTAPFIVSLFCGKLKPLNCGEFLADLLPELSMVLLNGIVVDGRQFTCKIHTFVCDAPARAFLKGIIGHSCERCTIKGSHFCNRVTFPGLTKTLRTNEKFRQSSYLSHDHCHQKELSPLVAVQMDLVNDFILDYMHLVCLGVVRRLLYFWKGQIKGTNTGRLSATSTNIISEKLIQFNGMLPSEFVRQPRSLVLLDRWKATELRSFLLYTGLVALRDELSPVAYKHFLSLTIAIRILCSSSEDFRLKHLANAETLLEYFVGNAPEHYGQEFNVYNVHGLLHIGDDVRYKCLPLYSFSCFPFEIFLYEVKKLVRGKHNPLVQIVKRMAELDIIDKRSIKKSRKIQGCTKNLYFLTEKCIVGLIVCNCMTYNRIFILKQ